MSLEDSVYAALAGYAGLSALVGARIYPDEAPQNTVSPYVVWQEISMLPTNDLNGSAVSGSLENSRVQVTCYAKKTSQAKAALLQARTAMFAASQFRCTEEDRRAPPFEPDTKLFAAQADFSVWLVT